MTDWKNYGDIINNSFYFVLDKIIDLMAFFMKEAYSIGRVVLLIAILSAGLNYALTGTGLKENVIKILKATLFFLIVMFAYPNIIGWITSYTFNLAKGSVYKAVDEHFQEVTSEIVTEYTRLYSTGQTDPDMMYSNQYKQPMKTFTVTSITKITKDNKKLFSDLTEERTHTDPNMKYTVVAPAAVVKIILFLAGECIGFADNTKTELFSRGIPDFSRVIKGLGCAVLLIFTGAFALLEYIVCFLEFMLVVSVGIILFPLSIWDGSKFLAEKFIGAIVGFFMKLLFCNIAIFLLIYGFISLFYIISATGNGGGAVGFTGNVDQIIFIVFTSLLYYFICKSAPGIAQSLLSGSPSLNAAGAIGAAAGMVGAATAAAGFIQNKASSAKSTAGSVVGGIAKMGHGLAEANAASKAAGEDGGSRANQAGAFMKSLGKQASQGLARSIYGDKSEGKTMGGIKADRQRDGVDTGKGYMTGIRDNMNKASKKNIPENPTVQPLPSVARNSNV